MKKLFNKCYRLNNHTQIIITVSDNISVISYYNENNERIEKMFEIFPHSKNIFISFNENKIYDEMKYAEILAVENRLALDLHEIGFDVKKTTILTHLGSVDKYYVKLLDGWYRVGTHA